MPATACPKILAFVEGKMERMFVNINFRHVDLVPIQNGDSWTIESMCEQIGSKFSLKNSRPDKIVVWIDKEKQIVSNEEFCNRVRSELVRRGAEQEKICICIPNRMTENLILADEEAIRNEFGDSSYRYVYEGHDGKSILKKMYEGKNIHYKETSEGLILLKKIRLERVAAKCDSARDFVRALGVNCWWVQA